jgi:hypothetical protein
MARAFELVFVQEILPAKATFITLDFFVFSRNHSHTDICFIAHVLQVPIVHHDFSGHHVDLVSDALEVSAVFLEDMRHRRLKAIVSMGSLNLELVSGIASAGCLLRLK